MFISRSIIKNIVISLFLHSLNNWVVLDAYDVSYNQLYDLYSTEVMTSCNGNLIIFLIHCTYRYRVQLKTRLHVKLAETYKIRILVNVIVILNDLYKINNNKNMVVYTKHNFFFCNLQAKLKLRGELEGFKKRCIFDAVINILFACSRNIISNYLKLNWYKY